MMREWLEGKNGYRIPGCNQLAGEKQVLIICHGFGSSKDSAMVEALRREMPRVGIGTYSFDFPCHGESPAPSEALLVTNCLRDLEAVEEQVRRLTPGSQISFFGSSFGAYILLLYLSRRNEGGCQAFLRSAAVDMMGIFTRWFEETPPVWQQVTGGTADQAYVSLDYEAQKGMRISRAFIRELEDNPVECLYPNGEITLGMVHGDADTTARYEDACRFAQRAGAALTTIPKGTHRLMGPGEMEQVLHCAVRFLKP